MLEVRRRALLVGGTAFAPARRSPAHFHDRDEIGPKMLARVANRTGLRPEDL